MANISEADVEVEAKTFITEHGDAACEAARAAAVEARNRGDEGLERFFAQVAVRIAERTGKHI